MAAPSLPTVTTLVTEGLRQARIASPTAAQIAIYRDEVMEQLKNSLWQELKQAKPLMTFSYMVLTAGQSRYSCPTDFASDMTMVVMTGLVQGPIASATANTLILPSTVGPLDFDSTVGKDVAITSGTGMSSVSQVTNVVTNPDTTITLTVYPDFQTTPDASSTFMIIDAQYPVDADHIANYDKYRSTGLDRPRKFYSMGDEDFDEFIFDVPPDAVFTYVVRMRYCVNIMTLDLDSTLMSTLYQKFREFWIYGVKSQALMDNDDTTADKSQADRMAKLQALVRSQIYGTDIHNLTQHVEDYY